MNEPSEFKPLKFYCIIQKPTLFKCELLITLSEISCAYCGLYMPSTRVKSGIFGQTLKFRQRPCLFHISNIAIKNKLTKQTVKILMRRLIKSRLIWIYTVCKCVRIYLMSKFSQLYSTYPHSAHEGILEVGCDSEIQGFPTCIKGQTCRHTMDHVVCCSPHLLLTLTVPMKAFLRLVVIVR